MPSNAKRSWSGGVRPASVASSNVSLPPSGSMKDALGKRSPSCWVSPVARSGTGSASTATRAWIHSVPCTTGAIPVGSEPAQVERLRQEIATGVFHNAEQVRAWIEEQFGVTYSTSGVKDLLHRIGASYHKVSGFFLEGGPEEAASVRAQVSAAPA